MGPALKTTSLLALAVTLLPLTLYSTATAFLPSSTTFSAKAPVTMVKLLRDLTGSRYSRLAELRTPSFTVIYMGPKPSCWAAL